jgi:hypothetical protein
MNALPATVADLTLERRHAAGTATVTVAGEGLILDPAGALYWPDERLLAVADLHFEKGSAFALRGCFVPPYDTFATLARLEALVGAYRPRRVICLGDSFHDRGAPARLPEAARVRLAALASAADWTWIAGNHDPAPPEGLGGEAAQVLSVGALTFRHEPTPGASPGEIAGHLHPSARVALRGRSVRRRAFAGTAERLVLPAFGAYTGGLNVLDAAFVPLFPARRAFSAWLLGAQVHRLDSRMLVPG